MAETTGYDKIASKYAAKVATKPIYAFYERPATLSLLPGLTGLNVLDAGCGSGRYSDYFLEEGATVTAVDANAELVEMTKQRTSSHADKVKVLQADLQKPLEFPSSSFDLIVSSLVMHYLEDWDITLSEFYRVLKPNGLFVFSTHHPTMIRQLFGLENYFEKVFLEDTWDIGKVYYYHRSLTEISQELFDVGFVIEQLLEPLPQEDYKDADPIWFEKLSKNPQFLFVRARKEFKVSE
jgi:SAM-dependent methyltransferase